MSVNNIQSLNNSEQIKIICKRKKITLTQLAKDALNLSIQNFSNRLSKNNLEEHELRKIAKYLNCEYYSYFVITEDTNN